MLALACFLRPGCQPGVSAVHKRHVHVHAEAADPEADSAAHPGSSASPAPWGLDCPAECTCQEGPFKEVPLRRLLASHGNYISLEDAALRASLDADRRVRQAVCVVLSYSFEDVVLNLPRDTQALTLLQSADDAAILLASEHLSRLPDLVSLDVTAFAEGGVHLRSDALRVLQHLRLLSLNGVNLEGALEDSNDVLVTLPPVNPRRRRLPPWAYRTDGQSEEPPQLVFLKPAEVVPFSKFTELRRVNAMRSFEGLEKLVMLRLHRAAIAEVSWEMFSGLDSLQVLSLEHNGLAYVPDWSLYGAPSLRVLSLANNSLLDVSSTSLVGLLELRFLDLSHNNLSHLSELSLPPFPKLEAADFRSNPIEAVFTSTFQVMNATETLLLGGSGTALQLRADMFLGLRALRRLAATDVSTPSLQRDVLRGMPRLKDLTLRGVIAGLPYDAFVEVPKLERLVLRQCGIRHVSMDAFYALFALQELDLSHNQLRSLPPSLLDQQTRLRELLLQGNQLKELPVGMMEALPAKMVRVDGNPWECSCEMAGWNPSATNKDKRDGRYVYDRRAAPACASPDRYAGWDVYDAMRRGFRCNKNPSRKVRPRPNALPDLPPPAAAAVAAAASQPLSNYVLDNNVGVPAAPATAAPPASSRATTSASANASPSTETSPSSEASSSTEASPSPSTTESLPDASSTAMPPPPSSSVSPPRRAAGGRRGGKHRHHPKGSRIANTHAHAQGEEGSQDANGKYLLADGRGGYLRVSWKAFKAAMEERRKNQTTSTEATPDRRAAG